MNLKRVVFTFTVIITIFSLGYGTSLARVMKVSGDVKIKPSGEIDFNVAATPGMALNNGDNLRVGDQGFAVVIYLDDKTILKIREKSEFGFLDTDNTRTVDMKYGTVFNQVSKEGRNKKYQVQTPVSVASVKGTSFWAQVDPSGIDQFFGTEGVFDVMNLISGQVVSVMAGQTAVSNALGTLMSAATNPGDLPQDPDPGTTTETGDETTGDSTTEQEQPQDTGQTPPDQVPPQTTPPDMTPPETGAPGEGPEDVPEPEAPGAGRNFGMGLGIGSVTIDGVIYNQFALRPEIKFGKLAVGLDVVLYIDDQGNIRKEEWDEASDIIDKFLYIRWAEKQDPFWFKLGALDGVTLGYGGLISGYSNMMEFPAIRRIGINMGVNMGHLGTELLLANIKDLARGGTLAGLRTTYKVSKKFPLTAGINLVADLNQVSGLKDKDGDDIPDIFDDYPENKRLWKDTDGDGYPDPHPGLPDSDVDIDADGDNIYDPIDPSVDYKADPFSRADVTARAFGFAADLGYPIFSNKFVALDVYTEFNRLIFPEVKAANSFRTRPARSGTGITIPGVRASILKFLNLGVEFRIKQQSFVPGFFDQSYDIVRVIPVYEGNEVFVETRDVQLFKSAEANVNTKGYYGFASAKILNIASFSASYANMKADTVEFNSFFAMLDLNTDFIPKLSVASAYYQRNNDPHPFAFRNPSENTILGYRLGYEISQGVSLIWDFRQFYRYDGEDLVPMKLTTIETSFAF